MTPSTAGNALVAELIPRSTERWLPRTELVLVRPGENHRTASETRRRVLNLVIAAIALMLGLPLMLFIAIAVKLTSRGPVLYRQVRVGVDRRRPGSGYSGRRCHDHGGRLFTMYRFRTMSETPARSEAWATPGDARVTPLGSLLRKYRLDELPQLLNVLKGDMNVVGPRPEQPAIFAALRDRVDLYPSRQRALPGITGWAQVNQSYDRGIEGVRRKVHLDIEYLRRASTLEDLKILALTVPVVLFRKGAW